MCVCVFLVEKIPNGVSCILYGEKRNGEIKIQQAQKPKNQVSVALLPLAGNRASKDHGIRSYQGKN